MNRYINTYKKFILILVIVQIICSFSIFAMAKNQSVIGYIQVYGNEPHTYLGLKSQDGTVFTLKASGESMINKGIYDGDIVIVQKQKVARNGDIVVAMTDEGEATLKTFYKESDHIRLQPENDTMSPIILDNCVILGKAIGLYRSL